jgi:hypothetical protein
LDGLFVAVFLILLAASVAVAGSLLVLRLLDRVLGPPTPAAKPMDDPELTEASNFEEAIRNWRREREVGDDV